LSSLTATGGNSPRFTIRSSLGTRSSKKSVLSPALRPPHAAISTEKTRDNQLFTDRAVISQTG
jgi:hypothetical protein